MKNFLQGGRYSHQVACFHLPPDFFEDLRSGDLLEDLAALQNAFSKLERELELKTRQARSLTSGPLGHNVRTHVDPILGRSTHVPLISSCSPGVAWVLTHSHMYIYIRVVLHAFVFYMCTCINVLFVHLFACIAGPAFSGLFKELGSRCFWACKSGLFSRLLAKLSPVALKP